MYEEELKALREENLLRRIVYRASSQGAIIRIGRRNYVNFSSNDYLGLSAHPRLVRAVRLAAVRYGAGAGASRLLAGGDALHRKLERMTASFKGTGAALLFNSGYAANTGIIPALADEPDVILSDELNHASIIDGCRLSHARTLVYRHRDMSELRRLARECGGRRRIVVTDTVFSMDGDVAPLMDICEICRETGSMLYLDDAHGTGVLGEGRGALARFGIAPEPWMVQVGTFSKALGSFGAFVAAGSEIIEWISNRARSFLFSTALPPPVVAASLEGLSIASEDTRLIEKLWERKRFLDDSLKTAGWRGAVSETPIVPLATSSVEEALRLSRFLLGKGFYVPAIRPPTVREPRLRITVTAAHEEEQIEALAEFLGNALRTRRTRTRKQGS